MKKVLPIALVCSVVTAILCSTLLMSPAAVVAGTVNNNESERGFISVSYTAQKEVSPDTVEISVAVKTYDKSSLTNAVSKNKEISDKIYNYLKSVINTTNGDYVRTSNYSANPSYNYVSGKRLFEKYEVSNNVIVHTKKLDKVSQMIDKSLALGATNVDSLNFSLSQKDQYCADLLANATKNAKQRAELVASSANTSVTGIKNISTSCSLNNARPSRYMYANAKMASSMMMDNAVEETEAGGVGNIESGLITVYSNVSADFYVK